jgi:glycosyltransferase involved in cell wall biosynthesis
LVAELRQKAPLRVKKEYSWDKVAQQYDQLFRAVVAGT